jgi:hypothetical protein
MEIARAGDDLAQAIRDSFHRELNDSASLDELIRIYDADKTKEIRAQILRALAERDDVRARTKLFEIARQGDTRKCASKQFAGSAIINVLRLTISCSSIHSETNLQLKQACCAFLQTATIRAHAQVFE